MSGLNLITNVWLKLEQVSKFLAFLVSFSPACLSAARDGAPAHKHKICSRLIMLVRMQLDPVTLDPDSLRSCSLRS